MSNQFKKRLRKNNKIIEKLYEFTEIEFYESKYSKRSVNFSIKDNVTGELSTGYDAGHYLGYYEHDKKGHVDSYSISWYFGGEELEHVFDIAGSYSNNGRKKSRNFKNHVSDLSYTLNHDAAYSSLLNDAVASGDCKAPAKYLDQLDGIDKGVLGDMSTSFWIDSADICTV
jgi:hypothetical protein